MRPKVEFVTPANEAYQAATAVAIPIQPPALMMLVVPLASPMPSTMKVIVSSRKTRLTAAVVRHVPFRWAAVCRKGS